MFSFRRKSHELFKLLGIEAAFPLLWLLLLSQIFFGIYFKASSWLIALLTEAGQDIFRSYLEAPAVLVFIFYPVLAFPIIAMSRALKQQYRVATAFMVGLALHCLLFSAEYREVLVWAQEPMQSRIVKIWSSAFTFLNAIRR